MFLCTFVTLIYVSVFNKSNDYAKWNKIHDCFFISLNGLYTQHICFGQNAVRLVCGCVKCVPTGGPHCNILCLECSVAVSAITTSWQGTRMQPSVPVHASKLCILTHSLTLPSLCLKLRTVYERKCLEPFESDLIPSSQQYSRLGCPSYDSTPLPWAGPSQQSHLALSSKEVNWLMRHLAHLACHWLLVRMSWLMWGRSCTQSSTFLSSDTWRPSLRGCELRRFLYPLLSSVS